MNLSIQLSLSRPWFDMKRLGIGPLGSQAFGAQLHHIGASLDSRTSSDLPLVSQVPGNTAPRVGSKTWSFWIILSDSFLLSCFLPTLFTIMKPNFFPPCLFFSLPLSLCACLGGLSQRWIHHETKPFTYPPWHRPLPRPHT